MTETDKLFALIASAILAALFAHRYADLPSIHIPTIIILRPVGSGISTD